MKNFGSIEKKIAFLLSSFPKLKNKIKKIYQLFNFLLNKKTYNFKSPFKISAVDKSSNSTFFGYYDKCPESQDGKKIIYFRTNNETFQKPQAKYPIQIILKLLPTNKEILVDETFAYNWQQGAKMMWLSNDEFIYNIYCGELNKYLSKIYNITSKTFQILDMPIYDCFKRSYALTINFNRLMNLRPDYGYRNYNEKIDFENYNLDGIFKLSIKQNTSFLLISIKQLIEHNPLPSMNGAKHKVNHIMISPDGTRFIFMHRWLAKSGKRYDRLLVSDSNNGDFKIVSDGEMVSHCCWKDNNTIVGYLRHNNIDGFYKIDLNDWSISKLSNKLNVFSDGHPTFNQDHMVFDSYPDRSRMKKLYIYDSINDQVTLMGEFFESIKYYNESRCDLHPRLNHKKNKIYFDSVHEGKRKLYYLKNTL